MKVFLKIAITALIFSVAFSFSSCSKKTYQAKRHPSPTIDPVSRKSTPVRKTYIVPNKRKKILGQQKTKI